MRVTMEVNLLQAPTSVKSQCNCPMLITMFIVLCCFLTWLNTDCFYASIFRQYDSLTVDFGLDNRIGDTPKRFLFIKNNSGIRASFKVECEYYQAPLMPTTPSEKLHQSGICKRCASLMISDSWYIIHYSFHCWKYYAFQAYVLWLNVHQITAYNHNQFSLS